MLPKNDLDPMKNVATENFPLFAYIPPIKNASKSMSQSNPSE